MLEKTKRCYNVLGDVSVENENIKYEKFDPKTYKPPKSYKTNALALVLLILFIGIGVMYNELKKKQDKKIKEISSINEITFDFNSAENINKYLIVNNKKVKVNILSEGAETILKINGNIIDYFTPTVLKTDSLKFAVFNEIILLFTYGDFRDTTISGYDIEGSKLFSYHKFSDFYNKTDKFILNKEKDIAVDKNILLLSITRLAYANSTFIVLENNDGSLKNINLCDEASFNENGISDEDIVEAVVRLEYLDDSTFASPIIASVDTIVRDVKKLCKK